MKFIMNVVIQIIISMLLFSNVILGKNADEDKKNGQLSGTVCFVKEGDLFIIDLKSKKIELLTENKRNRDPAWSLDGQSIFYLSTSKEKPKQINIYEYQLKTKKISQLTDIVGVCGNPYMVHKDSVIFWHNMVDPNSTKPALKLTTKAVLLNQSNANKPIINLSEYSALRLNKKTVAIMYDPTTIYKGFYLVKNGEIKKEAKRVNGMLGTPVWSPNNKFIAYQNAPDIHILNTENGNIINLTELNKKNDNSYFEYRTKPFWNDPAWSPDGKNLLCTHYDNNSDSIGKLYIINMQLKTKQFIIEGNNGV